ncbi:hypothetical protein WA026_022643 [Henosepilachna vigintioctopunctata]|uniref:Uncharacterized protein n=1 Tax=Henosepilachna vigintioctopunctata TaxID=420089 RepID=A0AAW1U7J1_9CUCU
MCWFPFGCFNSLKKVVSSMAHEELHTPGHILIKMVIEQGSNLSSGLYSFITMKLILALWLYFTIGYICTVLKSQIASFLIKPETYDSRTVKDLQRNDFVFMIPDLNRLHLSNKYEGTNLTIYEVKLPLHFNDYRLICPLSIELFKFRYAIVYTEFESFVQVGIFIQSTVVVMEVNISSVFPLEV